MFKIESASEIVMPPKSDIAWPWKDMKPGDLVRIHEKDLAHGARAAAHNYANRKGLTFRTKNIDGVLHVWRTA